MDALGAVGSLAGIAASIGLYRKRVGNEAARAYCAPIADALNQVEKGIDSLAVLSRRKDAIESAALLYRPTLRTKRATKLDMAMERFRHVCATVQPGLIAFYESQATARPSVDPKPQVTAALHELLALAA